MLLIYFESAFIITHITFVLSKNKCKKLGGVGFVGVVYRYICWDMDPSDFDDKNAAEKLPGNIEENEQSAFRIFGGRHTKTKIGHRGDCDIGDR